METIARSIRMTAITIAAVLAMACCFFAGTMCFVFQVQAQEIPDSKKAAKTENEGGSKTSGQKQDQKQQKDGEPSFDEAVEAFYSGSENMTDEQILQSARNMKSDVSALYSVLGEEEAADVEAVLNNYEASKADYLTDVINSEDESRTSTQPGGEEAKTNSGSAGIVSEWLLQSRYAELMITEDSVIREMIPRFKVTSCSLEKGILKTGIEEWMTQGYGARDGSGAVNASAYSYTFDLSLSKGENGSWMPCEVNGTRINYQWLQDESDRESEPEETQTPASAPEAGKSKTQEPARGAGQSKTQDPGPGNDQVPANFYAVRSDTDAHVLAYARIVTDKDPEASAASPPGLLKMVLLKILPAGRSVFLLKRRLLRQICRNLIHAPFQALKTAPW